MSNIFRKQGINTGSGGGGGSASIKKAIYEKSTALYNHAVNDLIVMETNNVKTLYKVTSAITAGDTITDEGQNANITDNTGIGADVQVYVSGIPNNSIILYDTSGQYDNDWNIGFDKGTATWNGTTGVAEISSSGIRLKHYGTYASDANYASIVHKSIIDNISDYDIKVTISNVTMLENTSACLVYASAVNSNTTYHPEWSTFVSSDQFTQAGSYTVVIPSNLYNDYNTKNLQISLSHITSTQTTGSLMGLDATITKIELIRK